MSTDELSSLISRAAAAPEGTLPHDDVAALDTLCREKPFFVTAAILLLRHGANTLPPERISQLQATVALGASDPRTTAAAVHGDEWAGFYPPGPEPEAKETVDVIDTFLATYGSVTPEEEALLEKMIFNPTPDYAEMLAREEQVNLPDSEAAAPDSPEARINAFILSQHPAARPVHEPEPEPEPETPAPVARPEHSDDSLLSESLAKIFIKQGRYERAYEIISGLNLKFPKKSAYFADQLRFLQKLIVNQRCRSGQNPAGASEK